MKLGIALGWIVLCAFASSTQAQFKPVPFPKDLGIPGFEFPAPEATIDKWVAKDDITSIAGHAWGLWTGLNQDSGQVVGTEKLTVFETWNERSELFGAGLADAGPRKRIPKPLRQFRFEKGSRVPQDLVPGASPLGFVKFDPTGADHIVKKKLLDATTLDNLLAPGKITKVPDFPATATSLKIEVVQANSSPADPGFFKLNVWPGPPAIPAAFGQDKWNTFIWIDLDPTHTSTGDGSVGRGMDTRKPATTYNLQDFIHFKDSDGKTEIVTGMHVTTREILRWTWQSYWWTPNPAEPPAPSSKAIAAARPKQLLALRAASHYAVTVSYSMRDSKDKPVFSYNPYLEASFSGLAGAFQFGVQTNCMSCHANASYKGIRDAYVGNENVDIADPKFQGQVRLDFLYSLQP